MLGAARQDMLSKTGCRMSAPGPGALVLARAVGVASFLPSTLSSRMWPAQETQTFK